MLFTKQMLVFLIIGIGSLILFIYLLTLVIRALSKYIKAEPIRNEKSKMPFLWVRD